MTPLAKILIVMICVLILVGAGFGVYFWKKSQSNQKSTTTDQSQTQDISQDKNGPYYHKIYTATSKDGLIWQKQNKLLFDHASVPGAVFKDSTIYLYFVDASSKGQGLSVAISKDLGTTFDKKEVQIKDSQGSPVDPNPVLLADGNIRLYYFASMVTNKDPAQDEGKHQIYSATSKDGITFENPKLAYEDTEITDPDVFQTEIDFRMLISKGKSLDLAISKDTGITFQKDNSFSWNSGGISDTIKFPDVYRTYFCGQGGIGSATGADTGKMSGEAGTRIAADNSQIVCDPAIIKLSDESYLMFYKVQDASQTQSPSTP